ncbi:MULTISPECIES: type II toxin-antitoxin system HipA family toxin YjjJ [unclassified Thioalkalivibrio]|uniref:type II toxin-antitoxin system HipA family toxin YjjJ n=1 Tax=unclassified Thioalkalivibrio TaxID=2621013 RepID=UPI00039D34E8|nr:MULTISPECIES: type II toxin-antitoxin system HipA family toxin YjjJ [unclassified Thioalkalivibrio]
MRSKREAAHQQLGLALARLAPVRAADLARELGLSVPTLHRLLQETPEPVLAAGRARRTRYALRRALRGDFAPTPIRVIDEAGQPHELTELSPIQPQGCHADFGGSDWPLEDDDETPEGWWAGLPYPLYDMRPQGYLGRQLAHRLQDTLEVSPNPDTWSDDDILWVLSRVGSDLPGNLVVGDAAFKGWQKARLDPPPILGLDEIEGMYVKAAEEAISLGLAGSSAAGEFPKFTALRDLQGSRSPHVIVKFSGADESATVQRWSDLLVAEHLALEAVAALPGVQSPPSRILQQQGRTFLEVERFDRNGLFGRSPVVTLETVNAALLGHAPSAWDTLAKGLADKRLLAPEAVAAIRHITWFGRLIANNDMHLGNLAFRPEGGRLVLCPVYDMLPMAYAPLPGGELPRVTFEPALPLPREHGAWVTTCHAAIGYWQTVSDDTRIRSTFRRIASENALELQRRMALVVP